MFYGAPLSAVPLLVAGGTAVVEAWLMQGGVGLIDMLLMLVLFIVELRYALGLLNRFARGYFDLSAHVAEENADPYTVYKVLVSLFAMTVVGSLLSALVPPLAWAISVALVIVMPAVVMRTTAYDSLLAGLNVRGWLHLIGVMRGSYAWLLGMCLLVLLGSGLTAAGLSMIGGGGYLSSVIASAVSNYALFVAFCMMGYGLFEHSNELGIDTRDELAARLLPRGHDKAKAGGSVQELLERGDIEAALVDAREEARLALNDPKAQERYFKLLEMRGEADKLPLQAARWLKACADANRSQDCARIVERWWVKHPTMLDDEPQAFLRAARFASQAGLLEEPLLMARHFQKTQGGSMLLPQGLLLEADHLLSRMRDPAGAKAKLLELLQRFPNSLQERRDAQATLAIIERAELRAPGASTS